MKKYSVETIVGIFVTIGLVCLGYMAIRLGKVSFFAENPIVLFARFNSVSGLKVGSPISGSRWGTFKRLKSILKRKFKTQGHPTVQGLV